MPTPTFTEDLAKLVAGLQVPFSIDPTVLGTAAEPWRRIWGTHLDMFGWKGAKEVEEALQNAIGNEVKNAINEYFRKGQGA